MTISYQDFERGASGNDWFFHSTAGREDPANGRLAQPICLSEFFNIGPYGHRGLRAHARH